jgi:hypothetical protein
MSKVFSIDDKNLLETFDTLSDKEFTSRVIMKALKETGKSLVDQTKDNLRKSMGAKATSKGKHKKALVEGVRMKIDKVYDSVTVDILGEYRLKWFEKGTKKARYTKKKQYRGVLEPLYFFQKAISDEGRIIEDIKENVLNQIRKQL